MSIPYDISGVGMIKTMARELMGKYDGPNLLQRHATTLDTLDRYSFEGVRPEDFETIDKSEKGLPYLLEDENAIVHFNRDSRESFSTQDIFRTLDNEVGSGENSLGELQENVTELRLNIDGDQYHAGYVATYKHPEIARVTGVNVFPVHNRETVDVFIDQSWRVDKDAYIKMGSDIVDYALERD